VFWIPECHSKLIHFSVNLQSTSFDSSILFINSSAYSPNVGGNSRVPSSKFNLPPCA
jgi:hypothetical protein